MTAIMSPPNPDFDASAPALMELYAQKPLPPLPLKLPPKTRQSKMSSMRDERRSQVSSTPPSRSRRRSSYKIQQLTGYDVFVTDDCSVASDSSSEYSQECEEDWFSLLPLLEAVGEEPANSSSWFDWSEPSSPCPPRTTTRRYDGQAQQWTDEPISRWDPGYGHFSDSKAAGEYHRIATELAATQRRRRRQDEGDDEGTGKRWLRRRRSLGAGLVTGAGLLPRRRTTSQPVGGQDKGAGEQVRELLQHARERARLGEANPDVDDPIFEPSLSVAPLQTLASVYYDATTMAALNAASAAAINRLRAYRPPPFPLWDSLPPRRRAAVLLLLYGDGHGHLRVVVTMRAASLRSFSGHAALPGGKADDESETPFQIARREAFEEIGLPVDDHRLPSPFRIEALCMLPPSLATTHLVVRPCVAFIHADRSSPTPSSSSEDDESHLVEESLIPRLDSREVAALFSAPLYNFLKVHDLPPPPGQSLPPGNWYDGAWTSWKDTPWRLHNFYVPVNNQRVMRPRRRSSTGSRNSAASPRAAQDNALFEDQDRFEGRLRVWGMTGRLLVDAARIAYDEAPEMEHNEWFGDADIITRAFEDGTLFQESRGHDAREEPAKI
ncbi:hypothetical protein CDD80_5659 [Ophiocordyceps camponoti-rufipedis]|uniref:Nudix hydrolase domain-containing protein n=1 Tax=Ophiocordyceps camponoti-rufipedis TaxID=2004952 RepID=A0A2C5YUB0_9HYPO|nr:hypothetical protein CDD80_5659 [Ophiocordyceps camponoti-rufipedis]